MENQIKKIRDLIRRTHLNDGIILFSKITKDSRKELYNDLIILEFRLNEIQNYERLNIRDGGYISIEKNKIVKSLLELLNIYETGIEKKSEIRSVSTIYIKIDLGEFNRTSQQVFINTLSTILEVPKSEIIFKEINAGSVILVLELPYIYSIKLKQLFKSKNSEIKLLLNNFPIVGILDYQINQIKSDELKQSGQSQVRLWGEKYSKGEWNWNNLGNALEDYLESLKYNPFNQHSWTNIAYTYYLIGLKSIAIECLQRSFNLAKPGSNFPGRNYKNVKRAVDYDSTLSYQKLVRPKSIPEWFKLKYGNFLNKDKGGYTHGIKTYLDLIEKKNVQNNG